MLDVFSAEVIPLLQRRGLFRTGYAGTTLREHYGLPWPESTFPAPALEKVSGGEALRFGRTTCHCVEPMSPPH